MSFPYKSLTRLLLQCDVKSSLSLSSAAAAFRESLDHLEALRELRDETHHSTSSSASKTDLSWLEKEENLVKSSQMQILEPLWPSAVIEFLDSKEKSPLLASTFSRHGAMVEVRQGIGGEEAALWTHELVQMYSKYAEQKRWNAEVIDYFPFDTAQGPACRAATIKVEMDDLHQGLSQQPVYQRMKLEAGVHRVKRVPVTERSGRIHTSTATVTVLPMLGSSEPEPADVRLDHSEVSVETFKSSGKGGQHANTTDTAVRLTHLPTGLVAKFSRMRSQHQNRKMAEEILRSKLLRHAEEQMSLHRLSFVDTAKPDAQRSSSVRTYHFLQSYVADHRLPLSIRGGSIVDEILNSPLQLDTHFVDTLILRENEARLNTYVEEHSQGEPLLDSPD